MIEKMIEEIKKFLPLEITGIVWDGDYFQMSGSDWIFETMSSWRISDQKKLFFGCFDSDSRKRVEELKGLKIVGIVPQTMSPSIDPSFILSDGRRLDIFSTDTYEPWVLDLENYMAFMPSLSDPEFFEKPTTSE